jgi:hypothetical protein
MAGDDHFGTGGGRGDRQPLRNKSKNKDNQQLAMAALIGVPWTIFAIISCLFVFAYHHYYLACWLVVLAFLMLAVIFMVLDSRRKQGGSWFLFLGLLSLFAIMFSSMFGTYNYWMHMFPYWSYDENRAYSNVLPTEPAEAHSDAGKIKFSHTARVDTTRAVGYKSGSVYCVAPILDDTQLDRVEYWAAGVDCCPARGDFNCDDTWNPKARSGVVILDTSAGDASVSSGDTSVGFHLFKSKRDMYVQSVREAEANFGLTSADYPLFVRWVGDPQQIQDDYWRSGVGFLVATICIYLLISVIAGAVMQMWSKKTAAAQGAQGGESSQRSG